MTKSLMKMVKVVKDRVAKPNEKGCRKQINLVFKEMRETLYVVQLIYL